MKPSRLPGRRAISRTSTFACGAAPAPTSAAKKPRCWKASRDAVASCAYFAAAAGYRRPPFGQPTVANNEADRHSPASVPTVLAEGAEFHKNYGMGRFLRARHSAVPARGQYQARGAGGKGLRSHLARVAVRLRRRLLFRAARSARSGAGGAGRSPAYVPESQFDLPMDYEAFAAKSAMVGHGGVVVFDDTVDMGEDGALRDGVLCDRVLRQMHAMPHRFHARRGGHRPHHCGRRAREEPGAASGP